MRFRVGMLIIVLGFSALAQTGFAQDYTLSNPLFLPPTYYVGDQVELRLTLRSPQLNQVGPPQELPKTSWGEILSIRVINLANAKELRIRFIAYDTGTLTLPPLNLGPLVLEEISLFVNSSISGETTQLEGPREQVLLPGTQAFLVLLLGGVLMIPLLWFIIFRWGRQVIGHVIAGYQERRPFRRAIRHIRSLRSSADSMHGREFYIRLLDEIRAYLSSRFSVSAFSLTTKELEQVFEEIISTPEDRQILIRLFLHGDMVKFANLPSTITGRMSHLDQAEQALIHLETLERKRRRDDQRRQRIPDAELVDRRRK